MLNTWAVLIPPVLVLICAIITHRVLPSLFLGIVSSALIVKNFNVINTVTFLAKNFWEQLYDASNLYTFAFLIVLGMLISLMSSAGGTAAYGDIIKNILKNARSAKFSSIILSILFMFDDFFSCLTVGCIMRPLTDGYKIPRAKLAFLIDSLAAPLVIIMPISTWIAMLLMQLDKSGISTNMHDSPLFIADPFVAYLHIIPFIFYSFITLFSVWFIVKHHISFGLMAQHEKIAQETGNLFGGKTPLKTTTKELTGKGALLDFIFPLASLVIGSFFAFLYSGNSTLFGGTNSFFETLKKADIFYAFFVGSVLAFIASMLLMMLRKKIVLKDLKPITQEGLDLMVGSIQILFFAWTFSSILKNDLQTGQYLAHLLIGALPAWLLPAMFFVTSLLTAIATGSSWGTIAVMVPLAVPMTATFFGLSQPTALSSVPLLLPILGSIFSGAVAGDHISPIGTTTVMSATSAGAYLDDHAWTQLPYALPGVCGTILAYLLAGLFIQQSSLLLALGCILSGIATTTLGLLFLNKKT